MIWNHAKTRLISSLITVLMQIIRKVVKQNLQKNRKVLSGFIFIMVHFFLLWQLINQQTSQMRTVNITMKWIPLSKGIDLWLQKSRLVE